jgi:hypothetical protein
MVNLTIFILLMVNLTIFNLAMVGFAIIISLKISVIIIYLTIVYLDMVN